ncbi:2-hydroxy-3-oxopropionate reductase [Pullulanibacillus sp. KACC 23026]|uniref:2-hydroxy-3-oxopropionate reductase n=1 Tax=Pullulanibacillus sp. KACC 23026 TaxID=3028315 RepID=UPI0023B13A31|nr:2-hydroxy-3-oxopropionate reductase [Pullulanibacillus sp. KACC 23026]WEG12458.1 2-hydroxy-3-oxopropionate reductase [Pullulanibacillus sp. KACC 23026]
MKVGFIGLGIMGKPMASHLIKNGFETYLLDLNKTAVNELAAQGGYACNSNKEIAEKSDVIITMLPAAKHVSQVLFGEDGIAANAKSNTIVIDMSSISSADAQSFSDQLKEKDIFFLDAPVSGGEPMAISGKLSIMVGGEVEAFNTVLPVFQAMGENIVHVGNSGAGQVAKLANQIIVSINLAAVSEAAVFASKAGIDLNKLYEAIRGGLAGSAVLDAKMPKIIERDFEPGGRIEINFKDLGNVQSTANALGVPLPVTNLVKEIFSSEIANGHATKDHSFIIDFFERMANHQTPKGGKLQ